MHGDLRRLLHETGSAVEAPAMVRRAPRWAARRAAALTVAALIGAAALIQGCTEGGVGFEPASPEAVDPDVTAPSTRPPEASELPETKEPTMPAPPDAAPEVVTEDQDGATFALALGDSTALRLSNEWLWDTPEASGAAVELVPVEYFADPGYVEWLVDAVAAGTSEVTVAGTPNCGEEAACPPRTVTLRFDVG